MGRDLILLSICVAKEDRPHIDDKPGRFKNFFELHFPELT